MPSLTITAPSPHSRAIPAIADLLTRQRLDFAFVGSVARSAWLGDAIDGGSIDVVALMKHEQRNQLLTMAGHRGFRVDRDEVEAADELDLLPLHFTAERDEVRVHVLLASNALYARMIAESVTATLDDRELRVPSAEDFALLLTLAGDEIARHRLTAGIHFNRGRFNEKLVSIGLAGSVVGE
jgi:hypothetical protein